MATLLKVFTSALSKNMPHLDKTCTCSPEIHCPVVFINAFICNYCALQNPPSHQVHLVLILKHGSLVSGLSFNL